MKLTDEELETIDERMNVALYTESLEICKLLRGHIKAITTTYIEVIDDRETRLRAGEQSYRELDRKLEHALAGLKDANEKLARLEEQLNVKS